MKEFSKDYATAVLEVKQVIDDAYYDIRGMLEAHLEDVPIKNRNAIASRIVLQLFDSHFRPLLKFASELERNANDNQSL